MAIRYVDFVDDIEQLAYMGMNSIINDGPHAGKRVALFIAQSEGGLEMLADDNCRLAREISDETLNDMISEGNEAGLSLAFMLALDSPGHEILAADDFRLAKLIRKLPLNFIFPGGKYKGESAAFWLTNNPLGFEIFALDDFRLTNLLDDTTINFVLPDGGNAGESVAYHLVQNEEYLEIFAIIAPFVSAETFNHLLSNDNEVDIANASVAFRLSLSPEGHEIMMADNYRLTKLIRYDTVNALIEDGKYAGRSIVHNLTTTDRGFRILSHDDYRILQLINARTMNNCFRYKIYDGMSLAFMLSAQARGRELLAANNRALTSLISNETLNVILSIFRRPEANMRVLDLRGNSVALYLSAYDNGRLLTLNKDTNSINILLAFCSITHQRLGASVSSNFRALFGKKNGPMRILKEMICDNSQCLAFGINDIALNQVIPVQAYRGQSVASNLCKNMSWLYPHYSERVRQETKDAIDINWQPNCRRRPDVN